MRSSTFARSRSRSRLPRRKPGRGQLERLESRELLARDLGIELLLQLGDFDGDGYLAPPDMDLLTARVRQGSQDLRYDVDHSGTVDQGDRSAWIEGLRRSFVGDSNVDGQFSTADLVMVFQGGAYEDGFPLNSTWTDGDWDGDGDFTSSDLVTAFVAGGYEQGFRTTQVDRLELALASRLSPNDPYQSAVGAVQLSGQTEPFLVAILQETGAKTVADRDGNFTFSNVTLPLGASTFHVTVCDVNNSQASRSQQLSRTAPVGGQLLAETNSFYSESTLDVVLDSQGGQQRLAFDVELQLDATSPAPAVEDRLLVYLVDAADPAHALLEGAIPGTPVFALTGQGADYPAGRVRFDGTTVEIDVTGVPDGTVGRLVFQLLGNDADNGTLAAVGPVTSSVVSSGTNNLAFLQSQATQMPGAALATSGLTLSANLKPLLSNVRYNSTTDRYVADLRVRNSGNAAVGRRMIVTLPNLPAGVQVVNRSGVLNDGTPYVNVQAAVPAGGLLPGAVSEPVRLELLAAQPNRFTIAPRVMVGGANQAPVLNPLQPVAIHPGGAALLPLNATDPDGDPLTYSINSASGAMPNVTLRADGSLQIRPGLDQLGSYSLLVTASDGAQSASRALTIDVTADASTTTRISGVVRSISGVAISGVPVELGGFSAVTAADGSFTIALPTLLVPTESFNVAVPTGDALLDPFNTGTQEIRLRRARYDVTTGDSPQHPRQHPNLVTSFLDAGVIYGSDTTRAAALRTGVGGRLKTSAGPGGTTLLPVNDAATFPNGTLENDNEGRANPTSLFAAGDVRANENVPLLALQTLLVREHNRLAAQIQTANPGFTDEAVYQRARKMVGAMLQNITYSEYLPLLLGPNAIPAYAGYQANVRPDESGLFAVAAFRIGHTQLSSEVKRLAASGQSLPGGSLELKNAFFTPNPIKTDGIEPYLRGLASAPAQEIDVQVIDDVRNFLFGPAGSGGLDLASLNIQRGRDMGLPSYNQARVDFGLPPVSSFAEITANVAVQDALQTTYGSVDLIDVWVGGIAEDHVAGAQVGPLFQRVIADQFARTRDADRYWFENGQFTSQELSQIRGTTLAGLIQRNTSITGLPAKLFTTGNAPPAPAPAGNAAAATLTDYRALDGYGNNANNPAWGSTQADVLQNYTVSYGDGSSTPAGADRPNARVISNNVNAQTDLPNSAAGLTQFAVFWGQLIDHDLGLTPGGVGDTLKVMGNLRTGGGNIAYPFVGERVDLLLDRPVFPHVDNVIGRPIYLPEIDLANAVTIDPSQTTVVTTDKLPGASVIVQPGTLETRTGQLFTGQLSITQVPSDLTPASLPANLIPDLVVTIQPADMVFTTPAPLTFPNTANRPPGTLLDLWSIDPITGQFNDVGDVVVSSDGSVLETVSGGIRNSSWHFVAPPPPTPLDPGGSPYGPEQGCNRCSSDNPWTSKVQGFQGNVIETHETAAYQSQGVSRNVRLVYDSLRADPRPIVPVGMVNIATETHMFATLAVQRGNFRQQLPGFQGAYGQVLSAPIDAHFWSVASGRADAALQIDLRSQPTGVYNYTLSTGVGSFADVPCGSAQPGGGGAVACEIPPLVVFSGSSESFDDTLISINSINSPFGAGWGIAGWEQITQNPDGSVLIIDGERDLKFDPPTTSGGPYQSPPGEFGTLELLANGTFRKTSVDRTVSLYNSANNLASVTDRNGNRTTYQYDAQGRLISLTDPVGLITRFGYTGQRVTSITDPANRVTKLSYDAAGNLQTVTDPDNATRTWEYDTLHHMTAETDQLGRREQTFYDFSGRATRAIRKDGSEVRISPIQTQAIFPPAQTSGDPLQAPLAVTLNGPIAAYVDGNGNVSNAWLDRAGQQVYSWDGEGQLARVDRDTNNQVTSITTVRGDTTYFVYDLLGNLTATYDAISSSHTPISGTITLPGESRTYSLQLSQASDLYFDALSSTGSFSWQLTGPLGTSSGQFSDNGTALTQLPPGPYELSVRGVADTVGDFRFRLQDFDAALPMPRDTEIRYALDGNEAVLFKLDATAGDSFTFDAIASENSGHAWRLLDPYSHDVFWHDFVDDTQTLAYTGTYTLVIEAYWTDQPSNLTFAARFNGNTPIALTGSPLVLGATVNGAINVADQVDSYVFTLASAANLYLDSLLYAENLYWSLTGPTGNSIVPGRYFPNSDWSYGIEDLRLGAGQYQLQVFGDGMTTGAYRFRLSNLAAATPVTVGTPVSGTLSPADETDIYRFSAAAGDQVYFDAQSIDVGNVNWRVIDPYGGTLFHQAFDDAGTWTLPVAGTYTLLVEAFPGNVDVGNYQFNLQPVAAPAPSALTLGSQINGSIGQVGEIDRFNFTLASAANLYLDSLLYAENLYWSLTGPTGNSIVPGRSFTNSDWYAGLDDLRLPAGAYVLDVFGGADATGAYRFRLNNLAAATPLTLGTPVNGTLSPASETDMYRFSAAAGDQVYFDAQNIDVGNVNWRVIDPYGGTLFHQAFDDAGTQMLPVAGTYTLLIEAYLGNVDVGNYQFNLQPVASPAPSALTLGSPISGSIGQVGEIDRFTFTLASAANLYLDSLVDDDNLYWSLTGPAGNSIVPGRSFTNSDWYTGLDDLRLPAGAYVLDVFGGADATGAYRFRLNNLAAATPLTLGTPVSGTLSPANETDMYRFSAAAGDQVYFDAQSIDVGNVNWRLIDPYGGTLFDQVFDDVNTLTLTAAGSYTLLIESYAGNTIVGNYAFRLQKQGNTPPIPFTGTTLSLGAIVNGDITTVGEEDKFVFTLASAANLYFDSLTNDDNLSWSLVGPAGVSVNSAVFSTSDWLYEPLSSLRLPAGAYQMTVDGLVDYTGSYSFRLLNLGSATALTPGTLRTSTLSPASETDAYRWTAAAGDRVYFDVQDATNMGSAFWRLLDPYGNTLFNSGLGDWDTLTLPVAGSYTLLVEGYVADQGVGNYAFNVSPVTNSPPTPLTLGTTVNGSIATVGETDTFAFTLASAANLYFDSLTNDGNLSWSLVGPTGVAVNSAVFSTSDWLYEPLSSLRLPAGAYQLTVDGLVDYTGAYSFRLLNLGSATALTPDTLRTSTLSPASETDAYRWTAAAGDRVYFDVRDATNMGSAFWRLLDPYGNTLFNSAFGDWDTLTLPVAGSYTLLVEGYVADQGVGNYAFNLQKITSVAPSPLNLSARNGKEFSYDTNFSQLTRRVDELGRELLVDINPVNGNARSTTQVVGAVGGSDDVVTQYTYTTRGMIDLLTDPLGRVTDYDYDATDRLTKITFAKGTVDQASRQYFYADATGNVTSVIDENGNQTSFQYDAMNRVIRATEPDPDGAGPLTAPVTQFSYDARGNLVSTTDPRGNVTQSQYDPLDRLVSSIDAANQVTSLEYDRAGNVTAIVDPLGHRTQHVYDTRNRRREGIAADGGKTQFTYDADDQLLSLTDPVANTTSFAYDARGRLTLETDPLGHMTQYTYDLVDNLIGKTDRDGRQTSYLYDDLDRLTTETWVGGGNVVNLKYDKAGNLTSVQDAFSALAFTYDNRDRAKTVDNNGTPGAPRVVLTYAYDRIGNITSVVDTLGGVAGGTNAYLYDALNRTTRITQSGTGVSGKRVDFAYNQLGQFSSIRRFSDVNGANRVVDTNYAYDALNRLSALTHNNGATDLAFYNFSYDAASRISAITDIDGLSTYGYDRRDQLTSADHSSASQPDETYKYDENGNRISSSLHGNGYVTGPGNRLLSDGKYSYAYDNEGNQVKRTEIATGKYREFLWDFRNRLTAVTDKNAANVATQQVAYSYDGLDRRISKAVDTTPQDAIDAAVTRFVYDRDDVLLDFVDADGSGPAPNVLDKRYLHGPAIDQILAQDSGGGNVQWMLGDQLGTVRDLVNNAGAVVNHVVYDSFGEIQLQSNSLMTVRYGFAGRESDAESALLYVRARYYSPSIGRFISQDPLGITQASKNTFGYAGNAPTFFVDRNGMDYYRAKDYFPGLHPDAPYNPANPDLSSVQSRQARDLLKQGKHAEAFKAEQKLTQRLRQISEREVERKAAQRAAAESAELAAKVLRRLGRVTGVLGAIVDILWSDDIGPEDPSFPTNQNILPNDAPPSMPYPRPRGSGGNGCRG